MPVLNKIINGVKMYFFSLVAYLSVWSKMTGKQKFAQANGHLGQMLFFDQPLF